MNENAFSTPLSTPRERTIFEIVILHHLKDVVIDITKELDIRFHTPIILVVCQERVTEKEAGLEPAHVPIRFAASVNDSTRSHVFATLCRFGLIDVSWVAPHGRVNLAIVGWGPRQGSCQGNEFFCELLVVQKHIRVIEFSVEAVFDLPHRPPDAVQVAVPSQDHKGCLDATWLLITSGQCGLMDCIAVDGHEKVGNEDQNGKGAQDLKSRCLSAFGHHHSLKDWKSTEIKLL